MTMSSAELLEQLTRTLGAEAASALMDRLPPARSQLATRDDLLSLEARIDARFEAVHARIGEANNEVLAVVRGELIAAITSQTRTMIHTMAGTVVTLVGFALALERLGG